MNCCEQVGMECYQRMLLEKLPQCFMYIYELFNDVGRMVNSQLIKAFRLVLLVEREIDVGVSKVH
jgi:hypothetical protein